MPNTSASGGYLTPTAPDILEGDELDDALTAAVAGITGLDGSLVRPKWQAKTPKRPALSVDWCALGVTETTPDAGPVIVHNAAGFDTYTRHKDVTVLVSFYGPNSRSFAQKLEDGLSIPQNIEELQNNSISFISAGTIRAVPESVNMQWIERYDVLIYLRRRVTRTYAIETIQTAGVELHVEDKVTVINVAP